MLLASLAAFSGCSSAETLAGQGGTCSLVTDCQDGLVCVPKDPNQPNGARICSSSTMNILPAATAMATATATPDSGAPPGEPPVDGGSSNPTPPGDGSARAPDEAGGPTVEAGRPPPVDAQPPQEAEAPPVDSGGGGGADAHAD
jgi:hypothetical protein